MNDFLNRNRRLAITIFAVIIVAAVGGGYLAYRGLESAPPAVAIAAGDHIASWNFKGAYADNAELSQKAAQNITDLKAQFGAGKYPDYDLYVSIAGQYELLGQGKDAYDNLNKAIAADGSQALAYANMGHLMDELGAYETAKAAYAKAVAIEPAMLGYHLARLDFLVTRFPTDTALIEAAFADSYAQFGDTPQTLQIKAQWYTDQGQYDKAIAVWKSLKQISPVDRQAAIDAEIARLAKKQ